MHLFRIACLCIVGAVGLPAQSIHLVGRGALPQIRDALALAAPGDVVHVLPGTYAHFAASVGVTIRALGPGAVNVVYDPTFQTPGCALSLPCMLSEGATELTVPAGQALHLVGLTFEATEIPNPLIPIRHRVVVHGGRVTFDQCVLRASNTNVLRATNASVHLQSCVVTARPLSSPAGGTAIVAQDTDLTAIDCLIVGGSSQGGMVMAGEGIRLTGGMLHGSNLEIRGGSILFPSSGPGALALNSTGAVWLSDSLLRGGCPLLPAGQQLSRCTLIATSTNCAPVPPSTVALLGISRPAPLRAGSVFALDYVTEPNAFVAVVASTSLSRLDLPALLAQPSWLEQPPSFLAALVLADASGHATASWPIPARPGIADQRLWFMGLSGSTFPLQASPPAGGVAR